MSAAPNFSRLSRIYRALELVAFGRDLERVRFQYVDRLRDCRSVLVLGEGDGRFLARLLASAPQARVHCIDGSPGMVAAAAARLRAADRGRVAFTCADVLTAPLDGGPYDAVVTLFFLDCFTTAQVEAIVARVLPTLSPTARWLFGDFIVPRRGWRHWRARAWLSILYTFFHFETGLTVRHLPDSERALVAAGFRAAATQDLQHGLLRSTVYARKAAEPWENGLTL